MVHVRHSACQHVVALLTVAPTGITTYAHTPLHATINRNMYGFIVDQTSQAAALCSQAVTCMAACRFTCMQLFSAYLKPSAPACTIFKDTTTATHVLNTTNACM